jgi:hypothetical protein
MIKSPEGTETAFSRMMLTWPSAISSFDEEPSIWWESKLNGDRVWLCDSSSEDADASNTPLLQPRKLGQVYAGHDKYRIFPHTEGVLSFHGIQEKACWDVLPVLLEPEQASVLIDGCFPPLTFYKLLYLTTVLVGLLDSDGRDWQSTFKHHVPKQLHNNLSEGKTFDFQNGFTCVGYAIQALLENRKVPSVDAVLDLLEGGKFRKNSQGMNHVYAKQDADFYFKCGGRVEYLLDGVLDEMIDDFDDADFECSLLQEDGIVNFSGKSKISKKQAKELLKAEPHPLDSNWEWVRYHTIGPHDSFRRRKYVGAFSDYD